jgi:hypothetical protein
MDDRTDGGAAFPHAIAIAPSGDVYGSDYFGGGMSLRDYFAGQALAGTGWSVGNAVECARDAYAIADAMLTARKEGGA